MCQYVRLVRRTRSRILRNNSKMLNVFLFNASHFSIVCRGCDHQNWGQQKNLAHRIAYISFDILQRWKCCVPKVISSSYAKNRPSVVFDHREMIQAKKVCARRDQPSPPNGGEPAHVVDFAATRSQLCMLGWRFEYIPRQKGGWSWSCVCVYAPHSGLVCEDQRPIEGENVVWIASDAFSSSAGRNVLCTRFVIFIGWLELRKKVRIDRWNADKKVFVLFIRFFVCRACSIPVMVNWNWTEKGVCWTAGVAKLTL